MNPRILLTGVALAICVNANAELATIYFKDGEASTVELVSVDSAQVRWKSSPTANDEQTTMRSQIDHVVFPTTGKWDDAEEARQGGELGDAIRLYEEVIKDPVSHYFPIPGNFASLAKERLLQCYRLQMRAERIAAQAKVVREEFLSLPPELRRVEPETAAWVAIADNNWEKASEAISEVETPTAETFFLKGRALEALGKKEEAVTEYAGAYVLNFGGSVLLTQTAIQRSSNLLSEIGDRERRAELQAQVKIYRDLYGNGSLWKDAPEALASLAEVEIKPLGEAESEMTKPEAPAEKMTGPVVTESATVATLAATEDRDYFLPEELPDKFFVIGVGNGNEKITPNGGVTKEADSYRFDGKGGFLRLEPFTADTPFLQIRLQFETAAPDGVLVHTEYPRLGGMTLYLKGGELLVDRRLRRGKVETAVLGTIPQNELVSLAVVFRPNGTRNTIIGYTANEDTYTAGGLKIPQIKHINIGSTGKLDQNGKTISGAMIPGFNGVIHHFSAGTGNGYQEVMEKTIARFGKGVRLLPPATPAEEEE